MKPHRLGTQVFAGQLPDVSFPDLLTRLGEEARLGGSYFLCQQDDVMRIAKTLEPVCTYVCVTLLAQVTPALCSAVITPALTCPKVTT